MCPWSFSISQVEADDTRMVVTNVEVGFHAFEAERFLVRYAGLDACTVEVMTDKGVAELVASSCAANLRPTPPLLLNVKAFSIS